MRKPKKMTCYNKNRTSCRLRIQSTFIVNLPLEKEYISLILNAVDHSFSITSQQIAAYPPTHSSVDQLFQDENAYLTLKPDCVA